MIQKIEANGINITYKFDGPADAPIVMLSNSLMSNHTMWDPQMAVLTESYRVLRYDTRGHGDTDAPAGPYSIKLFFLLIHSRFIKPETLFGPPPVRHQS